MHRENNSKVSCNLVSSSDPFTINPNQATSLRFLSQGPTLVVGFKSVSQCKIICKIIDNFPYYQVNTNSFKQKPTTILQKTNKNNEKFIETYKLPSIFTQSKKSLEKSENVSTPFAKQSNGKMSCKFIFVGGLVQGKIINHLDLEKLVNLDSSVYTMLIHQCRSTGVNFLFLQVLLQMKLLKSISSQHNLLYVLTAYKNDLIKLEKN